MLCIAFSTQAMRAQTSLWAQGRAIYQVTVQYGLGPSKSYEGELLYHEHASLFTYDKGTTQQERQEIKVVDGQEQRYISKGRKADEFGLVVYTDFDADKTIERNFIQGRAFLISDSLRSIAWTVLQEAKDIDGLACQKATATIYGRDYEAWFTTAVPIPYGPWKLQGLPGLIVEARSTDGEINFELTHLQGTLKEEIPLSAPTKGEPLMGYGNFFELLHKKANEFVKSVQTQIAEMQQESSSGARASLKITKSRLQNMEKTADL